jgi:hypothetical protein
MALLTVLSILGNTDFPSLNTLWLLSEATNFIMVIVNPMVTAMISIRIYVMARRVQLTPKTRRAYMNASSILIESAAPWTILGILYLTTMFMLDVNIPWATNLYNVWFITGVSIHLFVDSKSANSQRSSCCHHSLSFFVLLGVLHGIKQH